MELTNPTVWEDVLGLEVLELRKQISIFVKAAVNAAIYFYIFLLICHEHTHYIFLSRNCVLFCYWGWKRSLCVIA